MATNLARELEEFDPDARPTLACSIGVMAYNEEANIGRLLQRLLSQRTDNCVIREIVVLASGCTDRTEEIVRKYCARDKRVRLVSEPKRSGKASAVNLFLRHASSDILVSVGADTLPDRNAIQRLVEPFEDEDVGMTGGRPVPVNDANTFMGFAAHLLWDIHHHLALRSPKLGEITAYRRVFHRIPCYSSVDEANMEPLIRGQGYHLRYVPNAIVRNRGPETVSDFLKQRRRIYAGHLRMRREQGYAVASMSNGSLMGALARSVKPEARYLKWTLGVVALELYGRILGYVDYYLKRRDHAVWDVAVTTKGSLG